MCQLRDCLESLRTSEKEARSKENARLRFMRRAHEASAFIILLIAVLYLVLAMVQVMPQTQMCTQRGGARLERTVCIDPPARLRQWYGMPACTIEISDFSQPPNVNVKMLLNVSFMRNEFTLKEFENLSPPFISKHVNITTAEPTGDRLSVRINGGWAWSNTVAHFASGILSLVGTCMQIAMNFYMRCVHGHLGKIPMVIPAIIFIVIIIATVCLSGSMYFDRKDIANWSKITNDGRYYTIVNPHTADMTDDEVYDSVRDEDLTFFTARTLVAAFGVGVEDHLDNTYQFFSMTFQRLQYEIHFYLNVMLILLFLFSLIRLGIILALHLKMRITVYRARASCFSGESACSNCKTIYSLEYWPYECSMCGDHHCVKCASQTRMLVGASKESRVCNKCYGIANPWANATIPNVARELFASIAHAYFDKYCSASVGDKEERRGAKALRQHDFVSRVRATWGLFWPAGMEAIVKDSYVWLVANTNIELDDEEATLKLYDNGHVPTQWKTSAARVLRRTPMENDLGTAPCKNKRAGVVGRHAWREWQSHFFDEEGGAAAREKALASLGQKTAIASKSKRWVSDRCWTGDAHSRRYKPSLPSMRTHQLLSDFSSLSMSEKAEFFAALGTLTEFAETRHVMGEETVSPPCLWAGRVRASLYGNNPLNVGVWCDLHLFGSFIVFMKPREVGKAARAAHPPKRDLNSAPFTASGEVDEEWKISEDQGSKSVDSAVADGCWAKFLRYLNNRRPATMFAWLMPKVNCITEYSTIILI